MFRGRTQILMMPLTSQLRISSCSSVLLLWWSCQGAAMTNFGITYRLRDADRTKFLKKAYTLVGISGQPTDTMDLNMTVAFAAHNPNKLFSMDCDAGQLSVGYTFITALLSSWVSRKQRSELTG